MSPVDSILRHYGLQYQDLYKNHEDSSKLRKAKIWVTILNLLKVIRNVATHVIVGIYVRHTVDGTALLQSVVSHVVTQQHYNLGSSTWFSRLKLYLWNSLVHPSQVSHRLTNVLAQQLQVYLPGSKVFLYSGVLYALNILVTYFRGKVIFNYSFFTAPVSIRPWFRWYDHASSGLQPGNYFEKAIELGMILGVHGCVNFLDHIGVRSLESTTSARAVIKDLFGRYPQHVQYQIYLYKTYQYLKANQQFTYVGNFIHVMVREL